MPCCSREPIDDPTGGGVRIRRYEAPTTVQELQVMEACGLTAEEKIQAKLTDEADNGWRRWEVVRTVLENAQEGSIIPAWLQPCHVGLNR